MLKNKIVRLFGGVPKENFDIAERLLKESQIQLSEATAENENLKARLTKAQKNDKRDSKGRFTRSGE